jgi:protocatechuate 3,4-dioxygenase beta subunit
VWATIEGVICLDQNRNGQCEPGEPGIEGLIVELNQAARAQGAVQGQTTVTDARGYYRFEDVRPGSYNISVRVPAGYWPTGSTSEDVTVILHQTLNMGFGLYWPPIHFYLPVIVRQAQG